MKHVDPVGVRRQDAGEAELLPDLQPPEPVLKGEQGRAWRPQPRRSVLPSPFSSSPHHMSASSHFSEDRYRRCGDDSKYDIWVNTVLMEAIKGTKWIFFFLWGVGGGVRGWWWAWGGGGV